MVIPSSILSSATRGPDADFSSEGSKDILEELNDELTMKKRISDSEEEESAEHEAEFMGMCLFILLSFLLLPFSFSFLLSHFYTYVSMSPLCCGLPLFCMSIPLIVETFEEPGVAANIDMPTTTSPAAPVSPILAVPSAPISAVPTILVSVIPTTLILAICTAPTRMSPGVFLSLIFFFTSSL